ncbi:recombinase family protein [Myxococcota bacterium]|nr:recombinase family protein [Myxococcota bacterium]
MPIVGAAYLRCSDPRQDKSIEQQREEILRRAEADGVVIPPENWFVDEGLSGRSTRKRRAYLDLIRVAEVQRDARTEKRRAQPQRIDRLYVWAFSRLARNMFDALRALAALDEADIDVVSLTEPDAGDRSFRKLIRPILAWLAERYSEELSRNVQRGMRSQAERGFWQYGNPPYGYALEEGRLVVTDETRADFETVRRVFAVYLEGRDGAKRLAERLTAESIRPPSRRDCPRDRLGYAWRPKHVLQILRNPVYCGHIVHDGEVVARGVHEAAVSDEDFARVAALRKLKERVKLDGIGNGHHPIHIGERGLFTPWLRCGSCSGRIRVTVGGRSGKADYFYYSCASRAENKATCPGLSIRTEKLDEAVLAYIHDHVLSPVNVQALIDRSLADLAEQPDDIAQQRAAIEATIAELDRRIRLVGHQVLDGILAPSDAKALNAPLLAQRETAQLRLASLPQRRELPTVVDCDRFRAAVLEAWTAKPLDDRRAALDRLLDRITLGEAGAHIEYRAKDEPPAFRHQAPEGPPYTPMSARVPSGSFQVGSGSAASRRGEVGRRCQSSLSGSPSGVAVTKAGSTERLPSVPVQGRMAPS